jgi:hypothetical protein
LFVFPTPWLQARKRQYDCRSGFCLFERTIERRIVLKSAGVTHKPHHRIDRRLSIHSLPPENHTAGFKLELILRRMIVNRCDLQVQNVQIVGELKS